MAAGTGRALTAAGRSCAGSQAYPGNKFGQFLGLTCGALRYIATVN